MSLVIDASVALRWFINAPGSEAAIALLDGDEPLIAPDLVVAELVNATWKLVRSGEISDEHGRRIVAAAAPSFTTLVDAPTLANRAYSMAIALEHPVYDCLYVALAELQKTRVITADKKLRRKLVGTEWAPLVSPLAH